LRARCVTLTWLEAWDREQIALVFADEGHRERVGVEGLGVVAFALGVRFREAGDAGKCGHVVAAAFEHVLVLGACAVGIAVTFVECGQAQLGAIE